MVGEVNLTIGEDTHMWVKGFSVWSKGKGFKCENCHENMHDICMDQNCICTDCSIDDQRRKTLLVFGGQPFTKSKLAAYNGRILPATEYWEED